MVNIVINQEIEFLEEKSAWQGVKRVAGYVRNDMEKVFGKKPAICAGDSPKSQTVILYGTIGKSKRLDMLESAGKLELSGVRGKREVYLFQVVENPMEGVKSALVIAGSDKRGTIYGLFYLSEKLGVSPLVNWNHVLPKRREYVILTEKDSFVSKEPSVKYRGFFINDEWPAFGTWADKHFSGINAACYECVFELLLRLKGNYLWPAMWASNFNLDGPGLKSAELADELGVVMGTSHHEPCMRAGAEYGKMRGEDSPYGDAWSFLTNEDGITNFWRDGLIRNRSFENVITMGMRGENDTAILGADATMEDNVNLLRRVLKTQNQLIRETINENLDEVPRIMVLFTEVEAFFYGDEKTKGLLDEPELEGVTLMLSDNNQGAARTLPTKAMRNHKGGYGMYYHMDMHGGPMAFEWIGSTYLPKLWEQMTAAYEFGVQEIWVTNIGDIGTQEYGLSFFLDLAYDIDKWGGRDAAITKEYTKKWLRTQFAACFEESILSRMTEALWDYNRLLARRKHEVMNERVYHPVHFFEAEDVLRCCEKLLNTAKEARRACPIEMLGAFVSLFYFPVCGTANLMKMWILAGRNKLYAKQNRMEANDLADEVLACIKADKEYVKDYHEIDDGAFYGFGLSKHIGFRDENWNDENCQYPLRTYAYPADEPRMIVAKKNDEHYLTGGFWCERPLVWRDAMRKDVSEIAFEIACGSEKEVQYEIHTDCPWLHFSKKQGTVAKTEHITVTIDKSQLKGKETGKFFVKNVGYGEAEIHIEAEEEKKYPSGYFLWDNGRVAMDAGHYTAKKDVKNTGFITLSPYGRTDTAVKVYPVTKDFYGENDRPWIAYDFYVPEGGEYNLRFYLAPTTPVTNESRQYLGYSLNEGNVKIINTVKEEDKPFFTSAQWQKEAYEQIKITETEAICKKGCNRLYFYAMSPAIVLERIVLWEKDKELPESYLGPTESFFEK